MNLLLIFWIGFGFFCPILPATQNIFMYARASSGLITILPSMTSSGADSAPSGTHLLSWQSDYPPHKSISPPLSTYKKGKLDIRRLLESEESSERKKKMEGLVSFQPFPSSVIQRRLSTVYLTTRYPSSSSSSCAPPLRAQQVYFSFQFCPSHGSVLFAC